MHWTRAKDIKKKHLGHDWTLLVGLRLGVVCQPGTNALVKCWLFSLRVALDDRLAGRRNETISIEGDSSPMGFDFSPHLPSAVKAQTTVQPVGTRFACAGRIVLLLRLSSSSSSAAASTSTAIRRRRQHLTNARDCGAVSQFHPRIRCAVHRIQSNQWPQSADLLPISIEIRGLKQSRHKSNTLTHRHYWATKQWTV